MQVVARKADWSGQEGLQDLILDCEIDPICGVW
jgi:hypothetical protein